MILVYDANGNTTSSAGIQNFYDFENRMTQHGTGPGLLLAYDGDGNRVSETIGGTTTKFLVDDHNPSGLPQVLDEILNASVTRTYAYGYQRLSENQLISGTWTPSFYGYDGHGNVRFLTNSAGAVTDSYDYDAFGMPVRTGGATPNVFFYSGERLDNSIGLYDLRARYYNPATGRFWSMDPYLGKLSRPSTLHKYGYTANNPVNYTDPTGRLLTDTTALWVKVTAVTIAYALPLGEFLDWAFGCEGHEAASAVPVPQQPWSNQLPVVPWLTWTSGGPVASFSRQPPPPSPNIGPPAEPCTIPRPHLGLPPQGPPSLGPGRWRDGT